MTAGSPQPDAPGSATEAPGADGPAEVIETHTAYLFLVGDRAYKLKKSADLGFLDHRTREARRRSCTDEVALNRRLAPDVYLGVYDISGPDGVVLDHLVAMARMPDDRRLARCLQRGEDVEGALDSVADQVAGLHRGSTPRPERDQGAAVGAVCQRWRDGFDQLRPHAARIPGADRLDRAEELVERYLRGRHVLFAERIDQGWIRDGHGDLQAEDIFVLPDGPRVLDCIEFGDEFRWGDVLSDVAFLAMDLERLGRLDLAERFLRRHGELTGDRWPPSLAHHYVAYRAHIRAKVGVIRHLQHDEPIGTDVDQLIDLSLAHLHDGQVRLVLVGGLPGTGKSTLSARLGERVNAEVIRSDVVRRGRLVGGERYGPAAIDATYRDLLDEARRHLERGRSVVLDATWSDATLRASARDLAAATDSVMHEVRCTLPADMAAERIEQRRRRGDDPSEATPAVADAMASRFAPWPEAIEISTHDDPDAVAGLASRTLLAP